MTPNDKQAKVNLFAEKYPIATLYVMFLLGPLWAVVLTGCVISDYLDSKKVRRER